MRRAAHPREELAALALGALEGDEAAAVRAHVEGCDACRAELRSFEALPPLRHSPRMLWGAGYRQVVEVVVWGGWDGLLVS